jgi:ribosomal-protein-alanine N-acetyltransferase
VDRFSRELVIESSRLRLSLLDAEDAPRVSAYFQRNREHFAAWDPPRPGGFYTDDYWREKLTTARADVEADRAIRLWAVRRDDAAGPVLGMVNFTRLVRGPFLCAGVGYSLDEAAVGHGYMQEALRAAIAWMFEVQGFHRIEANYRPENVRSGRVLASLGFVIEGYARDYLMVDGAWRDHVLTSLTRHAPAP